VVSALIRSTMRPSFQLAAFSVAHIIRATASHHPGSLPVDRSAALNVIHVVNRVLSSSSETPQNKIKTCYTLCMNKSHMCFERSSHSVLDHLVKDDKELCQEVYERGTLEKAILLCKDITPLKKTSEWEEDEPESTLALREVGAVLLSP
jgi:hypothetical protein